MNGPAEKKVSSLVSNRSNSLKRTILLVEDSQFFTKIVKERIEQETGLQVLSALTFAEAQELLERHRDDIFLALLDIVLPDAPEGEIVDLVAAEQIPLIVFSASFEERVRDFALDRGAIDFVVKDSPASFQYLVDLVRRLDRNRGLTALVVDDSATSRRYMSELLRGQQLTVLQAGDGAEGLKVLDDNPSIKIVITDYSMPNMDGFEFIKRARRRFGREHLAVIGISASDRNSLSAKLLKAGANDFINKPFQSEEFTCRVSQNLDLLDRIEALEDAATKDPLTGLHNRRYFFNTVAPLHATALRGRLDRGVAMIDIDHFKRINDSLGQDAGDAVLRALADDFRGNKRETDILARFGGEEFCLLFVNMAKEKVPEVFETLRAGIESLKIEFQGDDIPITASIGVSTVLRDSLDDMIRDADAQLYEAKQSGRNRVALAPALDGDAEDHPVHQAN